jgi:cytoskeletal protein CcmA (bactofilin family)
MSSFLSVATLLFLTGTFLVLPLLPAIRELQHKTDASPLNVIQQHAGEIRYFADSFRTYLQPLEPVLRECSSSGSKVSGVMPDGTEYLVLGAGNDALVLPLADKDRVCPVLLVSATDLTLSPDSTFSRDVYSRARFVGGANNQYRALLADYEVHLGHGSTVMRWVHAGGELNAEPGCKLFGRTSSDSRIRLAAGCTFLRLNAPRIEFGTLSAERSSLTSQTPTSFSVKPQRLLHDGDFEIHSGEVFRGDLVVRGRLRIGPGAQIFGSIKSDEEAIVESRVRIHGSLICANKLLIGPDCLIQGPIISERDVLIQSGTQCGTANAQTTISATRIRIASGVVVSGSVWAREHGEVLASV